MTDIPFLGYIASSYPRIHEKIVHTWGTEECRNYLMNLINDSRDGSRQGFSPLIGKEIVLLLLEHDVRFPYLAVEDALHAFTAVDRGRYSNIQTDHRNGFLIVLYRAIAFAIAVLLLIKIFK